MLESCLAQLPQGNREVMVLRDVLELDTAETAALPRLDAEEAVRVPPARARAAVAAALTELTLDHVYEFDGARCDRVTRRVMTALAGRRSRRSSAAHEAIGRGRVLREEQRRLDELELHHHRLAVGSRARSTRPYRI